MAELTEISAIDVIASAVMSNPLIAWGPGPTGDGDVDLADL